MTLRAPRAGARAPTLEPPVLVRPLTISLPTAIARAAARSPNEGASAPEASDGGGRDADRVDLSAEARGPALGRLSDEQQKQVQKLKKRHDEVVAHELAHVRAGGSLVTSGPHYQYTAGPDGRQYAVAGHVNIDTSPAETPEATIAKAQQIRRAALAPQDPSAADRAVAATAAQLESGARAQLAESPDSDNPRSAADEPERRPRVDLYA